MNSNRSRDRKDLAVDTWASLLRVSQNLVNEVESALKSRGLPKLAWYDVLLELRRAGAGGMRPYELQKELLLAQYNLSRLLDRMTVAGVIKRLEYDEDRRGQLVRITAEGKTLMRKMWVVYGAAIEEHFSSKLDDDEVAALAKALSRLAVGS